MNSTNIQVITTAIREVVVLVLLIKYATEMNQLHDTQGIWEWVDTFQIFLLRKQPEKYNLHHTTAELSKFYVQYLYYWVQTKSIG
jgi:hypothetical protein